ncbi:MAG: tetratricopeptide repeat protein [Planctomycetes bacterium]|nr:tetratricopeptide repeat protein [Planctomycetota bacterium]
MSDEADARTAQAQLLYTEGIALVEAAEFDQAMTKFDEAAVLAPDLASPHNGRGSVLLQRGDVEEAFLALNEALRVDPAFAKAYCNRGTAFQMQGDRERALADFNEALRLDSSLEGAILGRARCLLDLQRFEESIAAFSVCIDSELQSAWAFSMRGSAFANLEQHDAAIADYDRALQLNPKDSWSYNCRGCLHYKLNDYEAAIADCGESIRLAPEYANAYMNRGRAYDRLEDHEVSIADYDKAIQFDPSDAGAYYYRARAWDKQDQLQNAIDDLTHAIRIEPTFQKAYKRRAKLLDAVGKSDEAEQDFIRVAELDPGNQTESGNMTQRKKPIWQILEKHFAPSPLDDITITERRFPDRVRADLQRAIDKLIAEQANLLHFCGVRKQHSFDGMPFSELLIPDRNDPALSVPPQYEEIDIGEADTVKCLKLGLWLLEQGGHRFALFLEPPSRFGREGGLRFQMATINDEPGTAISNTFFKHLENAVFESTCYRGKILSLRVNEHYSGVSTGISVHKLKTVAREQVILPRTTLDLLERNVIQFVGQRQRLNELGISTKKGLLFYGPPGTGKTHTIHYLAGALEGHTTLLVSAEQVGLLGEYMTLARLLQPSVVVLEDVDLIARDRTHMESACEEVLLNKLLNEMDGLQADADILFVLTTNRPETLEAALASRPGRVDQAIEFPLPDAEGRGKLVRLYSHGIQIKNDVVETTVKRTDKVSAAFIKELMRRAMQFHLERDDSPAIEIEDIDRALDELLFSGGTLNRKLLGAHVEPPGSNG